MRLKSIINFLILFCSIHLFMFTEWLYRYFGKVNFEQILIFLNFGTKGLLNTDEYVIEKYIQLCFYFPISVCILTFFFLYYVKKKNFKLINKILKKEYFILFLLSLSSIIYFFQVLEIKRQFDNFKNSEFIKLNYKKPDLKKIKEQEKKDLLLIYLESFNESYSTNKKFSKSTLDNLNFLNLNSIKIENFYETTYNNYTIGGIVSSQCGLPQKPIGLLDARFDKRKGKHLVDIYGLKTFLPKALCLGDILKYNNYKNIFINSINPSFQAMDIFFKDHGYQEILGKKYFIDKGYVNFDSWGGGVNDRIIFEETLKKINQMKSKNQRFNITLLTTDTHHPGYHDKKCISRFNIKNPDLNSAIHCTSYYLYKMIFELKKKYSESIKIVIIGDHLYPKIDKTTFNFSDEKIYNRIINSNMKIKRNEINHYDLFPSILDLLKYPYKDKTGLGYSVFREHPDLNYENYKNELINNIEKKSNFYYEFWEQ